MQFNFWTSIKNKFVYLFKNKNNDSYLSVLYDKVEKFHLKNQSIAFKISDIREKGFIIKVSGLNAYISFLHMPWKYSNPRQWRSAYPYLKGKIFFGEIFLIKKHPSIRIILNGEIPQFKSVELIEDKAYKGIIIEKVNFGLFIDIGYNFNWKTGSHIGLLHRYNFESRNAFEQYKAGDKIQVIFWGYRETDKAIFGLSHELKPWLNGEVENLIGTTLPITVEKKKGQPTKLIADNKYRAIHTIRHDLYLKNFEIARKASRKLMDGDTIHCKVININSQKRLLSIYWESVSEMNHIIESREIVKYVKNHPSNHKQIQNRANSEAIEKLKLFGKFVNVRIIKRKSSFDNSEYTRYIINDKFIGELEIGNRDYKVTEKEKKVLKRNLQNNDTQTCKVIGFENKKILVEWLVTDNELFSIQQ